MTVCILIAYKRLSNVCFHLEDVILKHSQAVRSSFMIQNKSEYGTSRWSLQSKHAYWVKELYNILHYSDFVFNDIWAVYL